MAERSHKSNLIEQAGSKAASCLFYPEEILHDEADGIRVEILFLVLSKNLCHRFWGKKRQIALLFGHLH